MSKHVLWIAIVGFAAMALVVSGCATTDTARPGVAEDGGTEAAAAEASQESGDREEASGKGDKTAQADADSASEGSGSTQDDSSGGEFQDPGPGLDRPIVMEERFEEFESENWELWGTVAPFNRVEVYEGTLELEGSNGMEAFGVYFSKEYDLVEGELTISMDITRNSTNEGSEICVWFVNQYLPNGSPWDEGDFVRANFLSTTNALKVQGTSPDMRGMGTDITEINNVWENGEQFHFDFVINQESFRMYVDGELLTRGETSGLTESTGYIHIHDWNSLEGDIDLIDNVVVRQASN